VGVGLLLAELPVAFFEKAPPGGLRLSLLIVPFSMGAMVLTRALVAVRRLMVLMVVNLVRAVVCLGLTFLFLKPVALGVLGALWGTILAEALLCVVVPVLLVRTNGLRLQVPRWRSLRLLLGYGIRFYFGRLGGQVNVRAGTALLAFLATKEQVGLFAVAMAAMSRTRLLPEAINTVLLPRTADDVSGRPDLVARWCRLSLLLSIPAIFVPLLFARPIVALVFSERFLPIVPLLWVLGLGVVIHGYPKIVGSYFNGIDRPGLTSWAVLSGVGVNLLLLPIFFWRLGLVGTAVAASVGYAIEAAVAIRWFTRASGVSVVRLWKLDRDDRWRIRRVFSRSHATTRADREA
jgi:O-antigen/teichoic acid export membrane protein